MFCVFGDLLINLYVYVVCIVCRINLTNPSSFHSGGAAEPLIDSRIFFNLDFRTVFLTPEELCVVHKYLSVFIAPQISGSCW